LDRIIIIIRRLDYKILLETSGAIETIRTNLNRKREIC